MTSAQWQEVMASEVMDDGKWCDGWRQAMVACNMTTLMANDEGKWGWQTWWWKCEVSRTSGYPRGIEDQVRKASMQVTKLKRFRAANAKTMVHLYKQLVLPIMEYPTVTTNALSKSRLATLQRVLNRALKQAYNNTSYPPRFTTEELHRKAKVNSIIYKLIYSEDKNLRKILIQCKKIISNLIF